MEPLSISNFAIEVIIALAIAIGNALVMWVIVRRKQLHTTTNVFIASLAASDTLHLSVECLCSSGNFISMFQYSTSYESLTIATRHQIPDSNGDTHTANKRFWSFIKHTRQDMTGIPNLIDDNGMEYTTSLTKAHALNKQFSSVFSKVTPTTLKNTASRSSAHPSISHRKQKSCSTIDAACRKSRTCWIEVGI